jgi:endonuclease/exonuclease/phosphatase family metal-dependent hydrolase
MQQRRGVFFSENGCGELFALDKAVSTLSKTLSNLEAPAMDGAARLMASMFNSPFPAAKGTYRFMTYNILYEEWASAPVPAEVEIRKEIVSGLVLGYMPDVIAFEEHFEQWGNQLPELLEEHYAYVCYTLDDGKVNRTPLLYRKDRFTLVDSGTIDLDDGNTGTRRVITRCVLQDKSTGAQFAVLGTHWDPFDMEAQLESAKTMAALAKSLQDERGLPVVAMGDFNAIPGKVSYNTFQSQSGLNHVTATNGVDHIFYTDEFTAVAQGTESQNCTNHGSDHYPVWLDVQFAAANS